MNDLEGRLEQRRETLRAEYEAGQRLLADAEGRVVALREQLLRISGALRLLDEELGDAPTVDGKGNEDRDAEPSGTIEP